MKRIEKEVPPSGKLLPPCPWHQHVLLGSLATMQTKSRRPLPLFRELMGEAGSGKLTKVWTAHRQRHSAREAGHLGKRSLLQNFLISCMNFRWPLAFCKVIVIFISDVPLHPRLLRRNGVLLSPISSQSMAPKRYSQNVC